MTKAIIIAGLFILSLLFAVNVNAQNIQGSVTDSTGKAVPFANVTLKAGGDLILSYTMSKTDGSFVLQIPAGTAKSDLSVSVSCVGFNKQSKKVTDLSAPANFILTPSVNQLQTVTIKNNQPWLRASGDTLSYKVSDFSNPQDRVIGDVIKKMPGITVAADGKISYNGKSVSNVYIGGDNLLDDKYNIATNTVPHGVVDQVQVIENNQPIKMLQDKVVSDDVALNLTIKKDAKLQLVGQESIGAGLPGI